MKLDHSRAPRIVPDGFGLRSIALLPGVLCIVGAMGCAGRSPAPVSSPRTPVSTAHLMAAELRDSDDAPRVGKSQRTSLSLLDDADKRYAEPARGGLDRKHGGFSGYK